MTSMLVPARQRGSEILDNPAQHPELSVRSLRDVELANRLFGGRSALLAELLPVVRSVAEGGIVSWLDVGAGRGDIAQAATGSASRLGVALQATLFDVSEASLRCRLDIAAPAVAGDALHLPFRTAAFDVVTCSQLLHHFESADAILLLREMSRVARQRVIVSDIRRSWIAVAGIWLASFPLGFHSVSRHDGVVSVLRGFTTRELGQLVETSGASGPLLSARRGFRVTASWIPSLPETAS